MGQPPTNDPPITSSTNALPPPSYSEATTTPSYLPSPSPTSTFTTTGLPPSSPLTTHLRALPGRFRTARLARQSAQAADELGLAALLVPHVEEFLAELTAAGGGLVGSPSSGPTRTRRGTGSGIRGELTLVPVGVVPKGARMSGLEERVGEGEVVRVGFVDVAVEEEVGYGEKGSEKKKGGGKNGNGSSGSGSGGALREQVNTGFDEWGRFDTNPSSRSGSDTNGWWFRDEDMARRLATYLRPEPVLERKRVQATVVQAKTVEKEKSGWSRWGLGGGGRKKSTSSEQMSPGLPSPISPVLSSPVPSADDDAVRMTVTAQEVTFRKENDFGVWESLTGWGVVVAVRISA